MILKYYKSLDRPVNIFGIRGGWLKLFGIGAGAAFVLALVFGFVVGTGGGMGIFIGLVAVDFFVCLVFQAKVPSRRLGKLKYRSRMNLRVVRRSTLASSIPVLDGPDRTENR